MESKWKYIGVINQIHDQTNNRLVMATDGIENREVIRKSVEMYNEGKTLREIDDFLLDAECSQEDRELIMEGFYKYLYSYEWRAVMNEEDCEGVFSLPLEHVNVGEQHKIESIGLYKDNLDGTQTHIIDITHDQIKAWNKLFMGYPYKKD